MILIQINSSGNVNDMITRDEVSTCIVPLPLYEQPDLISL